MTTNSSTSRRVGLRLLAALALLALLAAACGSDAATTTASTQAGATTSPTTAAPTTTAVPATTAAPASITTIEPTTAPPDTNSLAEGSGCTPGTTDSLPDGEWYGYVAAATADQLEFDLACWFTGEAAARAATEDGEESPPPNDYYVRNGSDAVRSLTVALDATAKWLPNPGDPATEELITYSAWQMDRAGRDFQPGGWLTIQDGVVIDLQEQYVP